MRPSTLIRRVRRPVVAILAAGVLVATAGAGAFFVGDGCERCVTPVAAQPILATDGFDHSGWQLARVVDKCEGCSG
jgi:hypothetical protein